MTGSTAHQPPAIDLTEGAASGYREIAAVMREWVRRGRYRPGDRMPSEAELMDCFQVSRVTVRRAVALLAAEGMLDTRRGRGSYVAADYRPPVSAGQVRVRARLFDWVDGWSFRLLGWSDVAPADGDRALFGADGPGSFTEFTYLRLHHEKPVGHYAVLMPDWSASLLDDRREAVLLHPEALLGERGVKPSSFQQQVGAIAADPLLARWLEIDAGTPILRVTLVSATGSGRIIQRTTALLRADHYEVSILGSFDGSGDGAPNMAARSIAPRESA